MILHYRIPLDGGDRFALVDVPADISEAEMTRVNRVLAAIAVPDDWSAATSNTSAGRLTASGGRNPRERRNAQPDQAPAPPTPATSLATPPATLPA